MCRCVGPKHGMAVLHTHYIHTTRLQGAVVSMVAISRHLGLMLPDRDTWEGSLAALGVCSGNRGGCILHHERAAAAAGKADH